MPSLNLYMCNKCMFIICPLGWGGYFYVIDDSGNRIPCPHPGEENKVKEILGRWVTKRKRKERTGFNSYCICLECLEKFELDIGDEEENKNSWRYHYNALIKRDERKCPKCGSFNVKTAFELIDKTCPKCKEGIIKEHDPGFIT